MPTCVSVGATATVNVAPICPCGPRMTISHLAFSEGGWNTAR